MLFAEETTRRLDSSSAGPWDPDIIGLRTCVFFMDFRQGVEYRYWWESWYLTERCFGHFINEIPLV